MDSSDDTVNLPNCPDCDTFVGIVHMPGCTVEWCMTCEQQRCTCKCSTDHAVWTSPVLELTEDEFDAQYALIPNDLVPDAAWGGCLFDTVGDEYAFVSQQDPNRIWTLAEDGDGNSLVCSGLHSVNRLGYLVSEKQVPDGQVVEVRCG